MTPTAWAESILRAARKDSKVTNGYAPWNTWAAWEAIATAVLAGHERNEAIKEKVAKMVEEKFSNPMVVVAIPESGLHDLTSTKEIVAAIRAMPLP